ncbi:MAG: 2-oxoacid:acceptor oxidoreductase subunit alpha [Thermoplasmatota archaeon]
MGGHGIAWQIAGTAGEGLEAGGETWARALAAAGQRPTTQRDFPSRIRGGDTTFTVRLTPGGHLVPPAAIDLGLAFNDTVLPPMDRVMADGGLVLVDEGVAPYVATGRAKIVAFPFTALAKEAGLERSKNMVALGASAALFSLELEALVASVGEQFASKGEKVVAQNRAALMAGHRVAAERFGVLFALPPPTRGSALFLSGNEAACLGALAAGCRVAAAYPITPASDVLEYLTPRLLAVGGVAVQTEDEMAALNFVLGAAFAGARALTATSGPGLSLMTETVGLAGSTETPCVILDCQRPGPSTGMPTKHAQEDLWAMALGGHGESVRVVLAPTDVADSFRVTSEAFRLAHRFRCPAFVALDQQLALFKQAVEPFDAEAEAGRHAVREPLGQASGANAWDGSYLAYGDSGGDPVRAAVPGEAAGRFYSNSTEHAPNGFTTESAVVRGAMVRRRLERMAAIPAECDRPVVVEGASDPEVILVSWGSTVEACREVMERSRRRVRVVALRLLWPFPAKAVAAALGSKVPIHVVEANAFGQLALMLKGHVDVHGRVHSIVKFDGRPLTSDDVMEALHG